VGNESELLREIFIRIFAALVYFKNRYQNLKVAFRLALSSEISYSPTSFIPENLRTKLKLEFSKVNQYS